MYTFNQIYHASTHTVEPCISFYPNESSEEHATVSVLALHEVAEVMKIYVIYNKCLSNFTTTDGNSIREVSFKFGYKSVTIDDNRHEPVTIPIQEFEEVLRHC
ncbi:MAG: hypothetical protein ACI381_01255 [Candidatus Methanomethylophilaceae archaeon]